MEGFGLSQSKDDDLTEEDRRLLEADEKLRKTLYEIHKRLMDMLFIRKKISMSLFDSDIQDDNERIRSIFADALRVFLNIPLPSGKMNFSKTYLRGSGLMRCNRNSRMRLKQRKKQRRRQRKDNRRS
jgi:hypothetical protein